MKKTIALILAALMFALLFAACGNTSGEKNGTGTAENTDTEQENETQESENGETKTENSSDTAGDASEVKWYILAQKKYTNGEPVTTTTHEWNDDFSYDCKYSGNTANEESYYENGNLVRVVRLEGVLTMWDTIRYHERLISYDESDRVTGIDYLYDGESVGHQETVYNADGSYMEYLYNADGELLSENEYDSSGNVIRKTPKDDSDVEKRYEYEFDDNGNVLKQTIYITAFGREITYEIREYEYNPDGTVKSLFYTENNFLEDNFITWQTDYTYDEWGNRIYSIKKFISDPPDSAPRYYDEEYYYKFINNLGETSGEIPG